MTATKLTTEGLAARQPSRTAINLVIAAFFLLGFFVGRTRQLPAQNLVDAFSHPKDVVDAYHQWYYDHFETTWRNTTWLGTEAEKYPPDMWVYQEIMYETKPDVLIEAGTFKGGSALYFASIFDLMKHGRVVTIDITQYPNLPQHPRITYLLGSSTAPEIFQQLKSAIHPGDKVMVSLDSDHHKAHVLKELQLYSQLVTLGNYLVVEDCEINGHPVLSSFGPGPAEAVAEFLSTNRDFVQDHSREKFGLTASPGGWLKRVR